MEDCEFVIFLGPADLVKAMTTFAPVLESVMATFAMSSTSTIRLDRR
jgi:hypothetical protein